MTTSSFINVRRNRMPRVKRTRQGRVPTHLSVRAEVRGRTCGIDKRYCSQSQQRGFVTVETAFALIGLGIAVLFLAGLLSLSVSQIRCADAAAQIARFASRDDLSSLAEMRESLPGAEVSITNDGRMIHVQVKLGVQPWGQWIPEVVLTGFADAIKEPE